MASTLDASSDFLLIEAGQTRTVTLTYKNAFSGLPAFLWERTLRPGARWVRVDASRIRPIGDDIDEGGRFRSPALSPGQSYEVLLYHVDEDEADPNRTPTDPPPDAKATVFAALKGPGPTELVQEPFESGAGGTYFSTSFSTQGDTFVQLSVSELEPVANADGVLEFAAPPTIGAIEGTGFFGQWNLVLASEGYLQGADYHGLLRVVDLDGHWQTIHLPFTTRLRTVVAQFTQIHIVNDGDFGQNTANFKGWIMEGDTPVASFWLPDRTIWDQPTPGSESMEWIELNTGPLAQPSVTLGPKATTPDDRTLSLLTRGIAKVEVGSDTASGNFLPGSTIVPGTPLGEVAYRFPIGLNEEVEEDDFFVDATPISGGEFAYSLAMSVTVTYE